VALPAGLTTVTVTGTYLDAEGTPLTGQVAFDISSPLKDVNHKVVLPQTTIRRYLDATGAFSVVLPVTDDIDLSPTGWYYTITERIDRSSVRSFHFLLPASLAPDIDVSELTPYTPPSS
jgi:hypothetical protein